MPCAITNMCKMEIKRVQNVQCVIVALANGDIRLYRDKHLIHSLNNDVLSVTLLFRSLSTDYHMAYLEEKRDV